MNDVTSAFDVNAFLDTTVETPFDTIRTTVPPKDDYLGVIDDVKSRVVETKQGARVILDLFWHILDEQVAAALNLPKPIVRQSVFVDFDETGTRLARGVNQNIVLGQVREAVGQNGPGAWAPRMLKGAGPARLKVSERIDEKNTAIKYNDVDRVTRMS